jgi:hypothetical protein
VGEGKGLDVLILDYLLVEWSSSDPGSSTSSSPISSSLTRPSTTLTTSLTPSQTSSESESTTTRPSTTLTTSLTPQTSSESDSTTTRVNPPIVIGAAIGGAIAGAMIVSLMLFACFARRRQRQKKNLPLPDSLSPPQLDMSHAHAGRSSHITPFVIGDHPSGSFTGLARGASASEGVVTSRRKEDSRIADRDLPPGYSVSPDNVR